MVLSTVYSTSPLVLRTVYSTSPLVLRTVHSTSPLVLRTVYSTQPFLLYLLQRRGWTLTRSIWAGQTASSRTSPASPRSAQSARQPTQRGDKLYIILYFKKYCYVYTVAKIPQVSLLICDAAESITSIIDLEIV